VRNLKENDWEENSWMSSILGFWEKDFLKDFVFLKDLTKETLK